jgi:antagonist of KipI
VEALEVVRPGLLSTVQDRGRVGYQKYGVPTSGAMDHTAFRAANLLVDNEESAAALEATGEGPALRALTDLVVAIVGADMEPHLNGRPIESGAAMGVRRGQLLELGRARQGLRAYLAIAGGIDVPVLLGSRSTCLPAAFGGFHGRALRTGDCLPVGVTGTRPLEITGRRLPAGWWGAPHEVLTLRVILGPQEDRFTPEGIETFLTGTYRLAPEMDRMGVRLQGPPIAHRSGADIISDSIPWGAIQVPADGQPIVLLADRQTTGGYTKIGVILREDTYRLAQATPGQIVRFCRASVQEAHAAWRAYEAKCQALLQSWQRWGDRRSYALRLGGRSYRVGVQEGKGMYRVAIEERVEGEPKKGE